MTPHGAAGENRIPSSVLETDVLPLNHIRMLPDIYSVGAAHTYIKGAQVERIELPKSLTPGLQPGCASQHRSLGYVSERFLGDLTILQSTLRDQIGSIGVTSDRYGHLFPRARKEPAEGPEMFYGQSISSAQDKTASITAIAQNH